MGLLCSRPDSNRQPTDPHGKGIVHYFRKLLPIELLLHINPKRFNLFFRPIYKRFVNLSSKRFSLFTFITKNMIQEATEVIGK